MADIKTKPSLQQELEGKKLFVVYVIEEEDITEDIEYALNEVAKSKGFDCVKYVEAGDVIHKSIADNDNIPDFLNSYSDALVEDALRVGAHAVLLLDCGYGLVANMHSKARTTSLWCLYWGGATIEKVWHDQVAPTAEADSQSGD